MWVLMVARQKTAGNDWARPFAVLAVVALAVFLLHAVSGDDHHSEDAHEEGDCVVCQLADNGGVEPIENPDAVSTASWLPLAASVIKAFALRDTSYRNDGARAPPR